MANGKPNPAATHQDYGLNRPHWSMCRILNDGEGAAKCEENSKLFLTVLPGHLAEPDGMTAYRSYVDNAYFFGAFGRTVDALCGLVNRIDPVIEVPAGMEDFMGDVTGNGSTMSEFTALVVHELVKIGRCGIFTDWPVKDEKQRVKADDEADFRRPRVTLYTAESILNWRNRRVGAKLKLSMVVLAEVDSQIVDEFEESTVQQIRVLDLDPDGYYRIRIYQLQEKSDGTNAISRHWVQIGGDIYPSTTVGSDSQKLDQIQFDFVNATDTTPNVQKPPLLDLAFTVKAHFRNAADHENALHLLGFPQAYLANYRESEELALDPTIAVKPTERTKRVFRMGTGEMWLFRNDVKARVLSVATDLVALENAMKTKQEHMVSLGARILARDKLAAEAARTEELRRQPENSALAVIAQTASKGLTSVLKRAAAWLKLEGGECEIKVNTSFFDTEMSSADLVGYIAGVQQGAFAMSDLRYLMRRGNLIRPGRTDQMIDAELEQAGISLSGLNADAIDNEADDAAGDIAADAAAPASNTGAPAPAPAPALTES